MTPRYLTRCALCYNALPLSYSASGRDRIRTYNPLILSQEQYICCTHLRGFPHFVNILYTKFTKISNFGSSLRIRTETRTGLSRFPLPVGIVNHKCVGYFCGRPTLPPGTSLIPEAGLLSSSEFGRQTPAVTTPMCTAFPVSNLARTTLIGGNVSSHSAGISSDFTPLGSIRKLEDLARLDLYTGKTH